MSVVLKKICRPSHISPRFLWCQRSKLFFCRSLVLGSSCTMVQIPLQISHNGQKYTQITFLLQPLKTGFSEKCFTFFAFFSKNKNRRMHTFHTLRRRYQEEKGRARDFFENYARGHSKNEKVCHIISNESERSFFGKDSSLRFGMPHIFHHCGSAWSLSLSK